MGLGVPLLLGLRLLDLDLERLPEPDLDGEEDISNVLLLQKKNILSCNLLTHYNFHCINTQSYFLLDSKSELSHRIIVGITMKHSRREYS